MYEARGEEMSQVEVWLHLLLPRSITVDSAKSGVPLTTTLARREGTQLRKLTAHGTALSNQCPISVDS